MTEETSIIHRGADGKTYLTAEGAAAALPPPAKIQRRTQIDIEGERLRELLLCLRGKQAHFEDNTKFREYIACLPETQIRDLMRLIVEMQQRGGMSEAIASLAAHGMRGVLLNQMKGK